MPIIDFSNAIAVNNASVIVPSNAVTGVPTSTVPSDALLGYDENNDPQQAQLNGIANKYGNEARELGTALGKAASAVKQRVKSYLGQINRYCFVAVNQKREKKYPLHPPIPLTNPYQTSIEIDYRDCIETVAPGMLGHSSTHDLFVCLKKTFEELHAQFQAEEDALLDLQPAEDIERNCIESLPKDSKEQLEARALVKNQKDATRKNFKPRDSDAERKQLEESPCGKAMVYAYDARRDYRIVANDIGDQLRKGFQGCEDAITPEVPEVDEESPQSKPESNKKKRNKRHKAYK